MEFCFKDAFFLKIKDCRYGGDEWIKEFLNECIYKHPNSSLLLRNMSDIYVLLALKGSDNYVNEDKGEKKWIEIMNNDQYELLTKNGYYVLGYILIGDIDNANDVHYIDIIDTRLRGHNLAEYMIDQYMKNISFVVPQKIIQSSAKYWKQIFNNVYFVQTRKDMNEFIEDNNINENLIDWKYLFVILDIDYPSDSI